LAHVAVEEASHRLLLSINSAVHVCKLSKGPEPFCGFKINVRKLVPPKAAVNIKICNSRREIVYVGISAHNKTTRKRQPNDPRRVVQRWRRQLEGYDCS